MAIYRGAAEKLVDVYDFDWKDNLRMKEACICSVESVIANTVNISLIALLAIVTGLWREIAIYFFTFAAMRFYAGGAHAKNYLQCIAIYVCIMLICIGCAKYCIPASVLYPFVMCLGSIIISGWINGKYAARQRSVGKRSNDYRKKARLIHRIISILMFSIFLVYMQTNNSFLREMIFIQSFALTAQSIALFIERKECVN